MARGCWVILLRSSKISGFYKLTPEERLQRVKEFAGLSDEEVEALRSAGALSISMADRMIENVVGSFGLPIGIATNFVINDKDYLIPMAIEEPSVVAAASNAAKIAREKGGFRASCTDPIMIGQIQLLGIPDAVRAKKAISSRKAEILRLANEQDPILVKLGGGAKDVEVKELETQRGKMLVIHLLVDCRDAMGANAVNTMAEAVAPKLEAITGGRALLRIISNLAVHRLAMAEAVLSEKALGGEEAVDGILDAYTLAASDPFRCATHNKGIMNGVDAVAIATGNDFRALEAGAHAYASINGKYRPLTHYEKDDEGNLVGAIKMPMAVGLVGGATAVHPAAKACIKILGIKSAGELAQVIASVGLAQNIAALKALATEGIQRGHMELHARNIAIMAGAQGEMIDRVATALARERRVRLDRAKELLEEMSHRK